MATTADLLNEAQTALHALLTGRAAVEIRDSDGSSIRYTQANISRLKQYIAELKADLAGSSVVAPPLRPTWG